MQDIPQIPRLIKVARENTLIGSYEMAAAKYKAAIGLIKNHLSVIDEDYTRDRWHQFLMDVEKEYRALNGLTSSWSNFLG